MRKELEHIEDPVERELTILQLVESAPGGTGDLCGMLPLGADQNRCNRLQERPHLWMEKPARAVSRSGPDGGLARPWPEPGGDVAHPFADVGPALAQCPETHDRNACQEGEAFAAAREGDAAAVAARCAGMVGPTWGQECIFNATEQLVMEWGCSRYPEAAGLCLEAGAFAANCQIHVVARLAGQPQGAHRDATSWDDWARCGETIDAAWREVDPDFTDSILARYWSDTSFRSVLDRPTVSGALFDVLPADAAPHVRAAVAWQQLHLERDEDYTLEEWVERVAQRLADRSEVPLPDARGPQYVKVADMWPRDREGEDSIPAQRYLGTGRRAWSQDVEVDLQICVLEAAARTSKRPEPVLAEGARSEDPLVAWTAQRLLWFMEHRGERSREPMPPGSPGLRKQAPKG